MIAPPPHGVARVTDIQAHAQRVVKRSADLMLNPYEPDTDHHTIWKRAAEQALAEPNAKGQGA